MLSVYILTTTPNLKTNLQNVLDQCVERHGDYIENVWHIGLFDMLSSRQARHRNGDNTLNNEDSVITTAEY